MLLTAQRLQPAVATAPSRRPMTQDGATAEEVYGASPLAPPSRCTVWLPPASPPLDFVPNPRTGCLAGPTPTAHSSLISTTIFPICFPSLSRSTAAIPRSNGNVESTLARSFPSPRRRMISAYSAALPMVEPMMVC